MPRSLDVIVFRRTRFVIRAMYNDGGLAVSPDHKINRFYPDELARREFARRLNGSVLGFEEFLRPNTRVTLGNVGGNNKIGALASTIVGKRRFATEALYRQSIGQKIRRAVTSQILGLRPDLQAPINLGLNLENYLRDAGSRATFRRRVLEIVRKYLIVPVPSNVFQGQVLEIAKDIHKRCT